MDSLEFIWLWEVIFDQIGPRMVEKTPNGVMSWISKCWLHIVKKFELMKWLEKLYFSSDISVFEGTVILET